MLTDPNAVGLPSILGHIKIYDDMDNQIASKNFIHVMLQVGEFTAYFEFAFERNSGQVAIVLKLRTIFQSV
jgi:hypothetical protein